MREMTHCLGAFTEVVGVMQAQALRAVYGLPLPRLKL